VSDDKDVSILVKVADEVVLDMALVAKSLTIFADGGGDVDSVQPLPSPDVIWATVPDYANNPQSTAFSEDVRAFMSGTGAATAVITIELVSGDTLATQGLTIQSSDNLDTAANNVAASVIRLVATFNSVAYPSNNFVFTVVATGTDVIAPTEPLMLSATAVGDSQVDMLILPPCDPKIPSEEAAGMDTVEIHRKVGAGAFSLLTTKDIDPGLSVQLFANTIGTHGASPSSSQIGPDWQLTAEGVDGIDTVSDEIYFIAGDVVGDFDLHCKIPSYTAPLLSKTAAQLMVRESLDADAKFITSGRLSNAGSSPDPKFSEVKWRPVTGGTVQFSNPQVSLSGDYYFWINRSGDVFTCYIFQQGDSGWTQNRQETIVMSASVKAGIFLNSGLAGTTATADFDNVCLQSLPVIAHSDTGLTAATAYEYKCKGVSL